MMRVVKDKLKVQSISHPEQKSRQRRRIPFMQNNDISVSQMLNEQIVLFLKSIRFNPKFRVGLSELRKRAFALRFGLKIFNRPIGCRLKQLNGMSHGNHGAHQSTKEMCIAVVPVGAKRVSEVSQPKLSAHTK